MNNQTQNQIDPQFITNLTAALGYTENGGKPNVSNPSAGKTGESKSIFQFEPSTWKAYSQQVFGKEVPITPQSEAAVALSKVKNWSTKLSQEGYSKQQIIPMVASMWNAGPGEPDAYTGKFSDGSSSQGVNKKYGVNYDVPGYAKKVESYFNQFSQSGTPTQANQPQQSNPQQTPIAMNPTQPKSAPKIQKKNPVNAGQMQGLNQGLQQTSVMKGLSLS